MGLKKNVTKQNLKSQRDHQDHLSNLPHKSPVILVIPAFTLGELTFHSAFLSPV